MGSDQADYPAHQLICIDRMKAYKPIKQQEGIALITAVLIVALATIAAATIAADHRYSIRRTENSVFGGQAWSYTKGAENWAKVILARDVDDNSKDDLTEDWATQLPAFPLPGGFIAGEITDAQSKINVNNLLVGDEVNPVYRNQIQRLFSLLEVDASLVDAIVDWIDPNVEATGASGAEDDYYVGLESPYLAANRPMAHISELRLVKGFTQEVYDRVSPYLVALPTNTAINVNTASAYVIAALSENIGLGQAEGIVEQRDDKPFDNIQAFRSDPVIVAANTNLTNVSTASSYFVLDTDTKIGSSTISISSTIYRADANNLQVILRTQQN